MANLVSRRNQGHGALTTLGRDPFHRLQDVFDSFFAPIMRQWSGPTPREFDGMRLWGFDMETNDNEVLVRAEMPGFEPADIDVSVEENVLTIRAENRAESEQEQDYRSYCRTTALPAGIDADHVTAQYRNGVLDLHIPRKEEAKPRRIRVQGPEAGEAKTDEAAPANQPEGKNG